VSNPQTAVQVIEQPTSAAMIEWTLDDFPVDRFNRLVPTQTLSIPTDLLRPVVQIVQLNPDPKGGDVYTSKDTPPGHAAPTKIALRKFAMAAGISIIDERRTDDGRDPDVIEVTCVAEMLLPTGQRIRATGMKRIDLGAQKWESDNHRLKFRSFFAEHVSSRAQNRAIRSLLSLRGSYPIEVYQRPFAVVSFAPNMAHPEVRSRILDAMAPAVGALYGPQAAPQLAPGAPIDVTPAPEEDPAPATPTVLPGEKLKAAAPANEDPAWMQGVVAPAAKPDFLTIVRSAAADVEDGDALAAGDDLKALGGIFAGWDQELVKAGLRTLWDASAIARPSIGQARALALAHESLGHQAFETAWRAMATTVVAGAAA
jgi:hypothetical protein